MKARARIAVSFLVALALVLVVAGSVFAAGPYASAIDAAGSQGVTDLTASIGDAFPYLLGLAIVGLIARRVLSFFRR